MELFLNLCWLALVLPAFVLWRRRVSSQPLTRASFVIVCTLGCALVLLFPVISASDDLHAVAQAMEESERGFRHDGRCPCVAHCLHQGALPFLPVTAALQVGFEPVGGTLSYSPHPAASSVVPTSSGRAPPFSALASL